MGDIEVLGTLSLREEALSSGPTLSTQKKLI